MPCELPEGCAHAPLLAKAEGGLADAPCRPLAQSPCAVLADLPRLALSPVDAHRRAGHLGYSKGAQERGNGAQEQVLARFTFAVTRVG